MDKRNNEDMCRSKKKVIRNPILAHPNFDKVFQVHCDVSGTKIGAILSQVGKLIALFSVKLNEAKKKYYVYD